MKYADKRTYMPVRATCSDRVARTVYVTGPEIVEGMRPARCRVHGVSVTGYLLTDGMRFWAWPGSRNEWAIPRVDQPPELPADLPWGRKCFLYKTGGLE